MCFFFVCTNLHVSAYVYVSWAFPVPVFSLFVLYYLGLFIYVIINYVGILMRRKECGLSEWGSLGNLEGDGEGETVIRIFFIQIYF